MLEYILAFMVAGPILAGIVLAVGVFILFIVPRAAYRAAKEERNWQTLWKDGNDTERLEQIIKSGRGGGLFKPSPEEVARAELMLKRRAVKRRLGYDPDKVYGEADQLRIEKAWSAPARTILRATWHSFGTDTPQRS
jgi:hypothetical protein